MNSSTPAAQSEKIRRWNVDSDWTDLAQQFRVRPGTCYLNHGSFGISPRVVREHRRRWIDEVDCQPMDIYVRQYEPEMTAARYKLAEFVGTTGENLVFAENATFAMNIIAANWPIRPGDQIVLNPHEYGAVRRIWNRVAEKAGGEVVDLAMPDRFEDPEELVESMFRQIGDRATLLVVSHITSPTALILPVERICERARQRGLAVCIDGPHAPAQIPVAIDQMGCDFYAASCHKWLCATLGSGFLYVHPRWQANFRPLIQSWGRLLPAIPESWDEEFTWTGTRDPSIYLSIPAAIDFHHGVGLKNFRQRCYGLAQHASATLSQLFKTRPMAHDSWYGTMAHVPLPAGDWSRLQERLWKDFSIEIPIINFADRWFVRVSCHLYTTMEQLDYLERSLSACLR